MSLDVCVTNAEQTSLSEGYGTPVYSLSQANCRSFLSKLQTGKA